MSETTLHPMGMDLKPINPTPGAPRHPAEDEYEPNGLIWGRYNWSGWRRQIQLLKLWGVDVSEFSGSNDGDIISVETCAKVADAIEAHAQELEPEEAEWLLAKVPLWRTCGGYEQF